MPQETFIRQLLQPKDSALQAESSLARKQRERLEQTFSPDVIERIEDIFKRLPFETFLFSQNTYGNRRGLDLDQIATAQQPLAIQALFTGEQAPLTGSISLADGQELATQGGAPARENTLVFSDSLRNPETKRALGEVFIPFLTVTEKQKIQEKKDRAQAEALVNIARAAIDLRGSSIFRKTGNFSSQVSFDGVLPAQQPEAIRALFFGNREGFDKYITTSANTSLVTPDGTNLRENRNVFGNIQFPVPAEFAPQPLLDLIESVERKKQTNERAEKARDQLLMLRDVLSSYKGKLPVLVESESFGYRSRKTFTIDQTTSSSVEAAVSALFSSDNPQIIESQGRSVVVGNNRLFNRPFRELQPEVQEFLKESLIAFNNPEVSQATREIFLKFVGSIESSRISNDQVFELARNEGTPAEQILLTLARRIEAAISRLEQQMNVVNRISTDGSVTRNKFDLTLASIQGDPTDEADKQSQRELTGQLYLERRIVLLNVVADALDRQRGSLANLRPAERTQVETACRTLLESPSEKDQELGKYLADLLYRKILDELAGVVLANISLNTNFEEVLARIDSEPLRPTVGKVDFFAEIEALKQKVSQIRLVLEPVIRIRRLQQIRSRFSNYPVGRILADINALPSETLEDLEAKETLLKELRANVAVNDPRSFEEKFAAERIAVVQQNLEQQFRDPEQGKNKAAFAYIRQNFVGTFFPLFEVLRNNPGLKDEIEKYTTVQGKNGKAVNPRLRFIQRITELEKQRPLTDQERNYLETVEMLTLFNPYVAAVANTEFGVADEFLRNHFDQTSNRTWDNLRNGSFVPAIQLGTGPDGLAFFGEVARHNPELASQTLVVDKGEQPGGPFAIPGGPAWELNSQNKRGKKGATMPDVAKNINPLKTVRAYGSPVTRWYPGERSDGEDVRGGSINTSVDYLITPDDISTQRYPTNEELQFILASQCALLARRVSMRTEVVSVRPNRDPVGLTKGSKIVTLRRTGDDGRIETKEIYTDAIFNSSGLGEPFYGFEFNGSRAEKVLNATKNSGEFPKVSVTLEALKSLANRRGESMSPPRTLVLSGEGNSTDVLIEYLGELFASNNPAVRNVEKIYVVARKGLSKRPRYARISDLKSRNNRENLVEFVTARVSDVGFVNPATNNPDDEPLFIYDETGKVLTDSEGKQIKADAFIANTGFRSNLDQVYANYLQPGQNLRKNDPAAQFDALTLPTNPDVPVADVLKADPTILFIGTSSRDGFGGREKLAQLPPRAREALVNNGVENAVAIGFRAPDSQAAARIFLDQNEVRLDTEFSDDPDTVFLQEPGTLANRRIIGFIPNLEGKGTADNVTNESDILSALLCYTVGHDVILAPDRFLPPPTVTLQFEFRVNPETRAYSLELQPGDVNNISRELFQKIDKAVLSEAFQLYALQALRGRRGDPKLEIVLAFNRGRLRPGQSYVQVS